MPYTYRLSKTVAVVWTGVLLVACLPLLYMSKGFPSLLLTYTAMFLWFIFIIWVGPVLVIASEGIKLHHFFRAKWEEITGAEVKNFLGLKYMLISRRKGFKWWVPLYYQGEVPIEEAILHSTPENNAVHELFK